MEMKEVYEKLEQMEGGAELITAIKSEVSKLNGEAKSTIQLYFHIEEPSSGPSEALATVHRKVASGRRLIGSGL